MYYTCSDSDSTEHPTYSQLLPAQPTVTVQVTTTDTPSTLPTEQPPPPIAGGIEPATQVMSIDLCQQHTLNCLLIENKKVTWLLS